MCSNNSDKKLVVNRFDELVTKYYLVHSQQKNVQKPDNKAKEGGEVRTDGPACRVLKNEYEYRQFMISKLYLKILVLKISHWV